MATQTPARTRKPARKQSNARREQAEARKAEIELATETVNEEAPDFRAFLARWGGRYNHSNLLRLWVQCPRATSLHMYGTWQKMGRQVRKGETAILLMQPRVSRDPERVTPDNPDGEVFRGASWMALFDFSQTDPAGEFDEDTPEADPGLVEEVRRLRAAALALHPDTLGVTPAMGETGVEYQEACARFQAAWVRYEAARDRLKPKQPA